MQLLVKLIRTFILLLVAVNASAQQQGTFYYSSRDGLPGKTIYTIHQDHAGFIWLGTDAGVCRFDGRTFEVFNNENGVSDYDILRVYEDSRKRIWLLTLNGKINYFENGIFQTPENNRMLAGANCDNSYFSFLEDDDQNIWIGSFTGKLVKIDRNNNLTKIDLKQFPYELRRGRLNLAMNSKREVIITNGSALINVSTMKYEPGWKLAVMKVFSSQIPGAVLYEQKNGLYMYHIGKQVLLLPYDEGTIDKVARFSIDSDTTVYIIDIYNNCIRYQRNAGKLNGDTLKFNGIVGQGMKDKDGNTWITTLTSGLYMTPAARLNEKNFDASSGLSGNGVISILPYGDTLLFAGMENGGFHMIENNSLIHDKIELNIKPGSRIAQFLNDVDGNLWMATDAGVRKGVLDAKGNVQLNTFLLIEGKDSVYTGSMKGITSNARKDIIISESDGLYYIPEGKGIHLYPLAPQLIPRQRVFTVFADLKGNTWYSTNSGLCCYDGKKVIAYGKENKLLVGRIRCIAETKDSILLVGTLRYGLVLMKNGTVLKNITVNDGLESNAIKAVVAEDSIIYIASDKGISRIALSPDLDIRITNINSSSGLVSDQVNAIALTENYVYVATAHGLSLLERPLAIRVNPPPLAYIKSFVVDDSIMDFSSNICVPYNFRNVIIDFTSPVFINSDQLRFRYRFETNGDWIQTRLGRVNLYGLLNGKYHFEIQAKRSDSDWGPVQSITFEVLPPFWKTWWFIMLVTFLVCALTWVTIKTFIRRKLSERLRFYKEQQALEEERRRISADMHDDLGADLTDIVIMSRIAKQTISDDQNFAGTIGGIELAANDVITKMNEIIWALNPGNDTLDNLISYLRNYSTTYSDLHGLELQFDAPVITDRIGLKASYRRNIFLAVKECLHNIVKHAGAGRIHVEISVEKNKKCLVICIRDDGSGMEKENHNNGFSGNGMLNLEKRMKEIGGSIDIKSGSGKGTSIQLKSCY